MKRELELCCETLQACEAAERGGADRIELCSALDVGGVTPPASLLRAALALTSRPVHVLIRPRPGLFTYDAREFALLCAQVEEMLAEGTAGVVVGVLDAEGRLDRERAAKLRRLALGRAITFHRAFDLIPELAADPEAKIEELVDLGYDRVLTSGGAADVVAGLPTLQQLAAAARGRIRVAAGGGVRLENVERLASVPGLDVHGSFRRIADAIPASPVAAAMGREYHVDVADVVTAVRLFHTKHEG